MSPQLDVTDAILDPMFADEISITRRPYTTGSNGRVSIAPTNLCITGVVTQGTPHAFEQQPDDQVGKAMITVHAFQFQLYDPVTGKLNSYQPDIINYNGNQYIVTKVLNWSRFGQGFTMAEAVLYEFTEAGQ